MNFNNLHKNFIRKCFIFRRRIENIDLLRPQLDQWQIHYLIESLLSDIWQSWNGFCRDLIILSCQGTTARNGSLIAARGGDVSEMRLAYEAKQYSSQSRPKQNGPANFPKRYEPTWGDLDSLLRIISGLTPANTINLLAAIGSFSKIKELQVLRNACAHKNSESIRELKSKFIAYRISRVTYLSDFAFIFHSGARLIEVWLYEMETIASLTTEK